MEKFKARKLKRLKTQKDGWEKAFQLISEKYKPNRKAEDIQRLLKDCGSVTASFTDRPIDAATEDELNAISKKFSIECKAQGKTTKQYYGLAEEQLKRVSKEYDEFEINYKKRQKKCLRVAYTLAGIIVCLFCVFVYLRGPQYLKAEKLLREENYNEALKWYSQCDGYFDARKKIEIVKRKKKELLLQSLGLEANLLEDIFTLGNEVPCGLVKYSISYSDLLNANKDDLIDKTVDTLTCGSYSLYGYSCEIQYYFDENNLLSKIEVFSPYGKDKRNFWFSDMTEITDEIEDKIHVRPRIYMNPNANYDCDVCRFEFDSIRGELQYEFVSNEIMGSYKSEEDSFQGIKNRFYLSITVKT